MKMRMGLFFAVVLFCGVGQALADTAWSTQDYNLYPGDFNGDGLTDMLYVSKDPSFPNGIVLSDGAGFNTPLQSWGNAYLGIPWSAGLYNIIVADFDGDGKADILLQRKTPGDNYLLLTEDGGVGAISQTISNNQSGLTWSADQHRIIAGDFNGDGKADLFFQALDAKGLNAVVLADDLGQFTAAAPAQSWNDGYAGFNWALSEANVYAGDFNGDGMAELLIQAQPTRATSGASIQPVIFTPNMNGAVLAQASKSVFVSDRLQSWSQDGFKANWSPLESNIVVGDFNGDGRADVILQGLTPANTSYLLTGQSKGAIFAAAARLTGPSVPTAETNRLLTGRFTGSKNEGLYFQTQTASQSNYLGTVTGATITATAQELPVSNNASGTIASTTRAAPVAVLAAPLATAVGRTRGQFAVSATGAATYRIPLWTPPGIAGLRPALALTYSSRSPDDLVGVGWSIGGASTSVTRCNKTYAQDSVAGPTQLSTFDRFCVNGNRLRLTSGTYGADGAQYQTEVAEFSLAISHGITGTGPTWFEVKGKDGLIYEYGNTTDSRLILSGTTSVRTWALNKIRDRIGNYIAFVYTNDTANNTFRPNTITYTTSPGTTATPNYQVQFNYETRTDPVKGFDVGKAFQEPNRLKTIVMAAWNGTAYAAVRNYTLAYVLGATTGRSRLATITESSPTQTLSPTTVTYQDGTAGWGAASTATGVPATTFGLVRADVNGDGIADLVYQDSAGTWYYLLGQASGTLAGPYSTGQSSTANGFSVPMDFYTTGKIAILIPNASGNWRILSFASAGGAFSFADTAIPAVGGSIAADVNGDGRPDLVYTTTSVVDARLNTGGAFAAPSILYSAITGESFGALLAAPDIARSNGERLDFNGDGRDDIVFQLTVCTLLAAPGAPPPAGCTSNQYFWRVLTSAEDGTYTDTDLPRRNGAAFRPVLGDFNGDGCMDLAHESSVTPFNIIVNFGTCTDAASVAFGGAFVSSFATTSFPRVLASDYDGDGRADLLLYSTATGTWGYALSTGSAVGPWTNLNIAGTNASGAVADVTGDGLPDFLYWTTTGLTYRSHNGAIPDLATAFTDGFGMTASPTYGSIAQGSYTKLANATYPEQDIAGPLTVVTSSATTGGDGNGSTYTVTNSYTGAKQNLQGRRFEGFSVVRSKDSRNNVIDYQTFRQDFPYTGMLLQDDLKQPDDATLMRQAINTVNTLTLASGADARSFPYVASQTQKGYEVQGTKNGQLITQLATNYGTPDIYGNFTSITKSTTDLDAGSPFLNQIWQSTTTNTFANETTLGAANWCLGRPTQVTFQNTLPGGSTATRTLQATYDYPTCRITQQVREPGAPSLTLTTNYGYTDGCNNVNTISIVGNNGSATETRTTTIGYGPHCTFPESITNALSQPSGRGYRYDLGLQTSETDPNNLSVSWQYDDLGRKQQEIRADGTKTTWVLTPFNSGAVRFYADETLLNTVGTAVRVHRTFYDEFDRANRDQTQTPGGTDWFRTNQTFDALGRVATQFLPYWDSAGAGNTSHGFTYDLANRPVIDTLMNGATVDRSTTIAYEGRTTKITDPKSFQTQKVADVLQRLRRVADPNLAQTNYTYDPFGDLVTVTDPAGNPTTFGYNIRGMTTSSSDPDRGAITYTPNAFGEVRSQLDAKNQTMSYAPYDALGRPTSRTEPEGTTLWTWGTSAAAKNIGQLQSVSSPGPYSESYVYDSAGRLQTATYNEDVTYQVDYAYNTIGQLDTITYPTSTNSVRFALKYGYDTQGYRTQVSDFTGGISGTVFWKYTADSTASVDPMGHIVDETLGSTSPIRTQNTYDPLTGELNTRKSGTGGTFGIQNVTYQWDKNDNVTDRIDANQANLTEHFNYDTLNRLTDSTLAGATNLTVGLNDIGNITSKTSTSANANVGSYTYGDATHKHAVTVAGVNTYSYDANGNMITRNGSPISWYSYNLPNLINDSAGNSSQFWYGANRNRWKQMATFVSPPSTGTETTIEVAGILEKVTRGTITTYKHYIAGGSGVVAEYLRATDGTTTTNYFTKDHLGSVDSIENGAGALLAKLSYDAYGQRRNAVGWTGNWTTADATAAQNATRRGYTYQEELDNLNLIHMNGRVYAPVIGRFLSADPYIDPRLASQGFDRFAYVRNNPLNAVDPSGFKFSDSNASDVRPKSGGPPQGDNSNLETIVVEAERHSSGGGGGGAGAGGAGASGSADSGEGNGSLEEIIVTGHRPPGTPKSKTPQSNPPCPVSTTASRVGSYLSNLGNQLTQAGARVSGYGGAFALGSGFVGLAVPVTAPAAAVGVAAGLSAAAVGGGVSIVGGIVQWVGGVVEGNSSAAGYGFITAEVNGIAAAVDFPPLPTGAPDPAEMLAGAAGFEPSTGGCHATN